MTAIVIGETDGTVSYDIGGTPPAAPLPIPYPYFFTDEILVYHVDEDSETLLTPAVDYTLAGVAADDGFQSGSITMITAFTDCTIRIDRSLHSTKANNFAATGAISIPAMNTLFSRLFSLCQDVKRRIEIYGSHSVRSPFWEFDLNELPIASERAFKVLLFDGDGQPIALLPSAILSIFPVRIITAGATVAMTMDDYEIAIAKTVGSPTLVTLPPLAIAGKHARVSDGNGGASADTISVQAANGGTINGATGALDMVIDWETAEFRSLGSDNWSIIQ